MVAGGEPSSTRRTNREARSGCLNDRHPPGLLHQRDGVRWCLPRVAWPIPRTGVGVVSPRRCRSGHRRRRQGGRRPVGRARSRRRRIDGTCCFDPSSRASIAQTACCGGVSLRGAASTPAPCPGAREAGIRRWSRSPDRCPPQCESHPCLVRQAAVSPASDAVQFELGDRHLASLSLSPTADSAAASLEAKRPAPPEASRSAPTSLRSLGSLMAPHDLIRHSGSSSSTPTQGLVHLPSAPLREGCTQEAAPQADQRSVIP